MNDATRRRLAAVVSADVVGYSRLMGEDEAGTLRRLNAHRSELIDPLIEQHNGRIVKTTGDGLLIEFASAVDAVSCAIDFQEGMSTRNDGVADDQRIIFRIGINLCEVIYAGDDIFGDGVNIAARLEGMAEPGGVLASETVYEGIRDKTAYVFVNNGELTLKNIAKPVRAWSWPRLLPANRQDRKPFVLMGDFKSRSDAEEALAEDLRDELTAALSRLTGLEVTVDQRKADYVLQGGIRTAADRCRLSMQLVSVEDEKQLWAERYDEDTDDPFEILDRCVPRIAIRVRRLVGSADAAKLSGKNLQELTVEQLLSTSGALFRTPTKDNFLQAGMVAEHALQKAPKNFMALCLAAAGECLSEFWLGFKRPDASVIDLALERVEEALRQTNKSDVLFIVYSTLLLNGSNRHEEAAAAAERSLQLNPDYNLGLFSLGTAKVFAGDYEAGIDLARRAYEIDIRDPYVNFYCRTVGHGHFAIAQFQEATEWFSKAEQLCPGAPHNLLGLATSQWHNKDHEAAKATLTRLLNQEPAFSLGDMMTLPFRDAAVWGRFLDGLRAVGFPD